MCSSCEFYPTCPPILPCGELSRPCRYNCPLPPPCCKPCCPPPVPCTPCPPCNCRPAFRPCPAPNIPDVVPPQVPELPACKPRRAPPCLPCPPPEAPTPCYPPALPLIQPEGCYPCPPPRISDPVPCIATVLPPCNPQCPPPILPKQRPICPRPPLPSYPCLPASRSCCPNCDPPCCDQDPVNRRRPLIVHNSVVDRRPTGVPANCFDRANPNVRYSCTTYSHSGCCYHKPVCLN